MRWLIDREVLERVKRIEVAWGAHGIDRFGVAQRDLATFLSLLCWFYRNYFRVSVSGIDHVPARGRAMLVGNHSGGVALDGAMVIASVFLEMDPPRLAQGMAEKFVNRIPFAAQWSYRCGQFTGLPENAVALLEADRLLMVFPEGARGTAKLYGDRNSLVEFGSGFMRLALATGTPIIPFAFLGGGEAIPTVANLYRIGGLLGVPYVPVTPWVLPLPRPASLELYYGEPIRFSGTGDEEDAVILSHVAEVKGRIAELLDQGQKIRRGRDATVQS